MDLSLTPDQRLIKEAAREFLTKECLPEIVREMEGDEKGFPPALWRKIAQLGWLGLLLPEEYGGCGPGYLDLIVLLEEMGRALAPVPLVPTVILGGLPLLYGARQDLKRELLPRMAEGTLLLTLALMEPGTAHDPTAVNLRASREGDRFVLDGTKVFVPYGHVADYLVCAARTGRGARKEKGVSLFLVRGDAPGVRSVVLKTLDCEKECTVVFDRVEVGEGSLIGVYNGGWGILERVVEQALVARCALMVGGAERVLEMTVAHAKTRVQFGRPIGSFQAVQHRCANMKIDLETARLATYEAAARIDRGLPGGLLASMAKVIVNQACGRVCDNGHQVLGGSGLMKEYDMELYSRRLKGGEFFLGDTRFHRQVIGKHLDLT